MAMAYLPRMRAGNAAARRGIRGRAETAVRMTAQGWMSSVYSATWHRITSGGGAPVAACGHRLYGPVHRRLDAPADDVARRICSDCRKSEVRSGLAAQPEGRRSTGE